MRLDSPLNLFVAMMSNEKVFCPIGQVAADTQLDILLE